MPSTSLHPTGGNGPTPAPYTREERRLRVALLAFAVLSVAFVVGYLLQGIVDGSSYPYVVNSAAKDGVFAFLCLLGAADVRRFSSAVLLLIAGHVFLVLGLLTSVIAGDVGTTAHTLGSPPFGISATTLSYLWVGADIVVIAIFSWLYLTAQRARFGLRYLGSSGFRALAAMAEVLVDAGEPDRPTGEQVAARVDAFLASFDSYAKSKVQLSLFALAYYPLLSLHAPLATMDPASRHAYVRQRLVTDVAERRWWDVLRPVREDLMYSASQMAYLGYYEDPRAAAACGYVRFSQRPEAAEARVTPSPPLDCLHPRRVTGETMEADVVIVGSGAGGATLAYELAERGREVLVLERGRHVDPSAFTEDEATQYSALYADGALELSTDFRFAVTQGTCVGGSTVVNNAVCFDIPEAVLARWVDPHGLAAGLDADRLRASFAHLRRWLPVTEQSTVPLNPGGAKFLDGVHALGLTAPPYDYGVVAANIRGCVGCGYCNIGCRYGKKLSMLDHTLPLAQREHPGQVRVLAECTAQGIDGDGRRAHAINATLSDGRSLRIRARTVIVSAGALHSSILLKRSGIGGARVGTGLAFNMATPITGDFEEPLHSERGLQISHYLEPPGAPGFAVETWFNPVVFQSLVMPGWLEQHTANMARYSHMTCLGAVVGTQSNATVAPARFGRGLTLKYAPTGQDFTSIVSASKLAGRILLAAGATRVMPLTFAYHEFTTPESLEALDGLVHDDSDLWLNSAHPQGGNVLSTDPAQGVVDPHFRVHGYENLYVCDASVFPSSITVNPQLTVMALAHYAAEHIA